MIKKRWSKTFGVVGLVSVVTISAASVAGAFITSTSGSQVIRLTSPPASVKLNALENATSVVAFDEAQGVTLTAPVAVDAVNAGTYTTFPNGNATIPTGTVVDSHLIHSDIPSRSYTSHRTGSVTFSGDILGVVASTARLAASDSKLGAPGTQYAGTTTYRGLESSEPGSVGRDTFTITGRTVTFDLQTLVMDELRVVTRHTNPLTTTVMGVPGSVQAGDNVTYTVKVTNNGLTSATNVQVQDLFPGATLVSAAPVAPAPGPCTGTASVTCTLGTIAAGGSASATIVVKSPSPAPAAGTITNTATSPPGQTPAATTTTTVVSPVLDTTIADTPDPVTAGNNVQYTLTVKNNGAATVANAHVVDTLPLGTAFVSATAPSGCVVTTTVDCSLGTLTVGASASAAIVVTSPSTSGTITDTAVATPGTNVPASETTAVADPVPGAASGFVLPGGSITTGGDNQADLTLPNTGDGATVIITQGSGTFCDGPCSGPATTIEPFPGYGDPTHPIDLLLTYNFPAAPSTDTLTQAANAYNSSIYKNTDPSHPEIGSLVPPCTDAGSGVADPHPCVRAKTITQTTLNSFVVTFDILYVSGDPSFGRK